MADSKPSIDLSQTEKDSVSKSIADLDVLTLALGSLEVQYAERRELALRNIAAKRNAVMALLGSLRELKAVPKGWMYLTDQGCFQDPEGSK